MKCAACQTEVPEQFKFCPECGSSVSALSSESGLERSIGDMRTMGPREAVQHAGGLEMDTLSERYERGDELGRGGFAVVHKANDKKLGRTVAIKQLHADHDGQTLERFNREARVIAGLNHRNIVGVHDVGEDANGLYLVMEYIDGGSLRDCLREKRALDLDETLRLMSGILQGLSYAHRRNLVHRDIKPSNILLQLEEGKLVPKIVDFGLAQAGRDSELSMTGYGMGSPFYMPPEQRRDAKNVNHTADIYAVGKVLYEMVTGEIPDTLDPSVIPSAALSSIIFKCTKPRPHDRYFSVDELLRELESLDAVEEKEITKKSRAENECPACGLENVADVKFCQNCGAGLFRQCAECNREDSVNKQFCGACGTDIQAFDAARDILQKMERYAEDKKWSRAAKEGESFNPEVRLPGEKGVALCKAIQEKLLNANKVSVEIEEITAEVANLKASSSSEPREEVLPDLEHLLVLLASLSRLTPLSDELRSLEKAASARLEEVNRLKGARLAEEQRIVEVCAEEEKRREAEKAEKIVELEKKIDRLCGNTHSKTTSENVECQLEAFSALHEILRELDLLGGMTKRQRQLFDGVQLQREEAERILKEKVDQGAVEIDELRELVNEHAEKLPEKPVEMMSKDEIHVVNDVYEALRNLDTLSGMSERERELMLNLETTVRGIRALEDELSAHEAKESREKREAEFWLFVRILVLMMILVVVLTFAILDQLEYQPIKDLFFR